MIPIVICFHFSPFGFLMSHVGNQIQTRSDSEDKEKGKMLERKKHKKRSFLRQIRAYVFISGNCLEIIYTVLYAVLRLQACRILRLRCKLNFREKTERKKPHWNQCLGVDSILDTIWINLQFKLTMQGKNHLQCGLHGHDTLSLRRQSTEYFLLVFCCHKKTTMPKKKKMQTASNCYRKKKMKWKKKHEK